MDPDLTDEATYEHLRDRTRRTADARPLSRRGVLRLSAGAVAGGVAGAAGIASSGTASASAASAVGASSRGVRSGTVADVPASGIIKPLPPELFIPRGTNAEMRWEAMRGQGLITPVDRFFVRNHVATPRIDARTWRLKLWGSGLQGSPTEDRAFELSYTQLLTMRARTITTAIECTGNGRSFYTTQQNEKVSGTPWTLGAVGVARWRGVPLADVLRRAGLSPTAVDVLPRGLDADFVDGGENMGRVRRPLPIEKALKDVLVAYEMNGAPLPPDHGFPVRLVVPHWVGIASIKWLGDIEVADHALTSPWNTRYYRMFGPSFPPEGSEPLTTMNVKSAFELPFPATLDGREVTLTGRSWSGTGRVRRVEVSTDGGAHWQRAHLHGPSDAWARWSLRWRPPAPGSYELLARATDDSGHTQPSTATYNTLGYLFGAVVRHPVTIS
ncbi:sulfite oxidase [Actinomadura rupiterrae]|uniref:sulfite oxidase n=1 Tax=Actinomadura rupiterrae TaxID=559627 RepID=UPI0020A566D5|nr:sulfite oxidase [Actinomadura rupiterrae]MCP2338373.1 DMSO/TMAO reductase YedYZ molybdopterin-dependent catalytic subunit [Actinomadura rupiterrae]